MSFIKDIKAGETLCPECAGNGVTALMRKESYLRFRPKWDSGLGADGLPRGYEDDVKWYHPRLSDDPNFEHVTFGVLWAEQCRECFGKGKFGAPL